MLTDEQRQLAADNHNLIYKFARSKRLDIREYYDLLAIGLCKAAGVFDASKKVRFSNVAYKCMFNECKMFWRQQTNARHIPKEKIASYDVEIGTPGSDITMLDALSNSKEHSYDFDSGSAVANEFMRTLTGHQKDVLLGLLSGAPSVDVAETLGCTRQNVCEARKKIQNRWQNYNMK